MTDDPEAVVRAYVRAFETLDPGAVVPFYALPCLFLAREGQALAADPDAARTIVSRLMDHARAQGYERTEIPRIEARPLADGLATCTGTFARQDASGREIARFGFTYVLRRDGGGGAFQIAVAIAHDPVPEKQ